MSMYLTDDTLGRLDLGPMVMGGGLQDCNADGYVVTNWIIGAPDVRAVVREKALGNGTDDDTRFLGARAVSVNVVVDVNKADPQLSLDRLEQYTKPRYRPRLHWTVPGSTQERSMLVRGVSAPTSIQGRQAHVMSVSWVGPLGIIESPQQSSITINPGSDTEDGRTYDLDFDRVYPFSLGIGDRLVVNAGTEVADWEATIFGSCEDPVLTINGIDMAFTNTGGIAIGGGTSLVLASRDATVYLNGDPTESRYDKLNFTEWSWEQVRLQPGNNIVSYSAAVLGAGSTVQFRWRSAW